jgi:predicted phosphodiesterase
LGDVYTVALLVCFSVFVVESTVTDKWWQTFFRVAIETHVDAAPELQNSKKGNALTLAHVSDLHAHIEGGHLIEDPKRRVSVEMIDAVLSSIIRDHDIDAVVCSGDSTDDGSVGSWKQLLTLASWAEVERKLILAPGNHDLNYLETGRLNNFFLIEKRTEEGMHLRALRYLKVANLVMGERAKLISPFTGGVTTLREAMERMEADFELWGESQKLAKNAMLPLEFLGKCFPMAVTTESTEDRCVFFVWNTVKKNSVPIWNSVGEMASDQVDRARELLRHIPSSMPLIHVMHHQVTLPRAKTYRIALKRLFGVGMALNYSHRFFDWVAELRQCTVLLHGHHHKAFFCVNADRNVGIVSAPSGTLGCEESFFEELPSETKDAHWLRVTMALKGADARVTQVKPVRVVPDDETSIQSTQAQALQS